MRHFSVVYKQCLLLPRSYKSEIDLPVSLKMVLTGFSVSFSRNHWAKNVYYKQQRFLSICLLAQKLIVPIFLSYQREIDKNPNFPEFHIVEQHKSLAFYRFKFNFSHACFLSNQFAGNAAEGRTADSYVILRHLLVQPIARASTSPFAASSCCGAKRREIQTIYGGELKSSHA